MKKPWSISTTVRNPERLRDFLAVLKKMEGEEFTPENQVKYQILLIQERLYKPINLSRKLQEIIDDPESKITFEKAKEIFNYKKYEDPPMRGRQSVNPLNKLGFSIAREGRNKIIITELGNRFLQGDYDLGFIFFKSLLKLQFPNPWSGDFKMDEGFDIMPLIAVMKLIKTINKKSDEKGLSSREFKVFIPTLINASKIKDCATEIINFRKEKNKDRKVVSIAKEFYGTKKLEEKKINNLFDYGDNIMRYFRLTKYFRVETDPTGSHWSVDLEPSRMVEIDQLLEMYDGYALKFKDTDEYLNYLSDIEKPKLPWEKEDNLRKVAVALKTGIIEYAQKKNIELKPTFDINVDIENLDKTSLNGLIADLRTLNLSVKETAQKIELMTNRNKLIEIIKILKDTKLLRKFEPERFEKLITEALKILNDEILIKPNYAMDDNGEPISHAPAGRPDIECYYDSYKAICEVTLSVSKLQWVQEAHPVMRHLRDFENKFSEENILCLFVAPLIHNDTLSVFWFSVKSGYDGKMQKIIPITTEQLAALLETLLKLVQKGKRLNHKDIFSCYMKIINETNNVAGFTEWAGKITGIINEWGQKVVAQ